MTFLQGLALKRSGQGQAVEHGEHGGDSMIGNSSIVFVANNSLFPRFS